MHKSQVLFYLIIAFLVGVFVASFLPVSQSWILVFLIFAIGLIAVSGHKKKYSRKGLLAGIILLIFIFGIIRFNSFNFSNSILNHFADVQVGGKGIAVILNGYIDDEPNVDGVKSQLVFRVKELVMPDRIFQVYEKTLLMAGSFPVRKFGDRLSVSGSLQTPKNFKDFDYVQYLKNKNIRTVMFSPKITEDKGLVLDLGTRFKINLYGKLFKTKELFENSINRSLPEPYAAYTNGILLGSRQNIPQSIKDSFSKTSTSHIMAISGYNITIIAEALLAVLVLAMRRRRAFWISVIVRLRRIRLRRRYCL